MTHSNGTNGSVGSKVVVGRIRQGAVYRFHQMAKVVKDGERVTEDVDGLLYEVVGFAWHVGIQRYEVVYRGVEGDDEGNLYVASLGQFAGAFRPAEPVAAEVTAAVEPVPEKVVGAYEGGGI